MQSNEPNCGELKIFRNIYKELEEVYDIFPKLCGLSGTEYWALYMIYEGISTQYEICEHLSLSRQTVNSAFKQLKKIGFIRLETMYNNLRVKQVYLTDTGKKFVEKQIGNMHKLEENVWHMMSEEERIQIIKLLYKYKALLSEALQNYKDNLE